MSIIQMIAVLPASKVLKKYARETVAIAVGEDGHDILIDMDTVNGRMLDEGQTGFDKVLDSELREIIRTTEQNDASYIHLY